MNSSGPRARGRHPDHREQAKIKPLRSNAGTRPVRSPPSRRLTTLACVAIVGILAGCGPQSQHGDRPIIGLRVRSTVINDLNSVDARLSALPTLTTPH